MQRVANSETLQKVTAVPVILTIPSLSATYTVYTDSNGDATFTVPNNTVFTVTFPQREGWYLHEGKYTKTYNVTTNANFTIPEIYYTYESGLYIVTTDGTEYTFDGFKAAVDAQTRTKDEAKIIKVFTGVLAEKAGVFGVDIDHLRSRSYGANQVWNVNNAQFNSIPLNGNSISALYYYDGYTACGLVAVEANDRGLQVPAITKCLNMSTVLTPDAGDSSLDITLPGFLGSVGQWSELWKNREEVDSILVYTRPDGSYTLSGLTTQKWTCTQAAAYQSYYWAAAAGTNNKNNSYVTLPFFAF